MRAKNNVEKQKEGLIKQKNDALEAEKKVKKRENKLADLKKELSLKYSEREKIRHPGVIIA